MSGTTGIGVGNNCFGGFWRMDAKTPRRDFEMVHSRLFVGHHIFGTTYFGDLCQLRDTIDIETGPGWQAFGYMYLVVFALPLAGEEEFWKALLWASLYIFSGEYTIIIPN
jgi:hypothetical protein